MNGRICIFGDTVLRKRAKPIKAVGENERKLFEEMLTIMRAAGGVGLAAPQIGLSKRMIVIEYNNSLLMIANPKIIKKEGYVSLEEGCLSFPEISVRVRRSKKIVVEALDKNNKKFVIEADEILARALQHEIDHLDGKLIIDYANLVDKFRIRKRIKEIRAKFSR